MTPELKRELGVGSGGLDVGSVNGSSHSRPLTSHSLFEAAFAEAEIEGGSELDAMQFCDLQTMLRDDLLHKCDRVTMAVALEARVPFLDHEMVEWAFTLPEALRVSSRFGPARFTLKYLLKQWLSRYLPAELVHRRKQGFEVPVYDWLTGPLRAWMRELLLAPGAHDEGLLSPMAVGRLVERLEEGERILALPVYSLLAWQLWRRQCLKQAREGHTNAPLRLDRSPAPCGVSHASENESAPTCTEVA
jgi:asparagine synthetase B (glutamine-hydrolysing)